MLGSYTSWYDFMPHFIGLGCELNHISFNCQITQFNTPTRTQNIPFFPPGQFHSLRCIFIQFCLDQDSPLSGNQGFYLETQCH